MTELNLLQSENTNATTQAPATAPATTPATEEAVVGTKLAHGAKTEFVMRCFRKGITEAKAIKAKAREELGADVEISDNTISIVRKKLSDQMAVARAARGKNKVKAAPTAGSSSGVSSEVRTIAVSTDLVEELKADLRSKIFDHGRVTVANALGVAFKQLTEEFSALSAAGKKVA